MQVGGKGFVPCYESTALGQHATLLSIRARPSRRAHQTGLVITTDLLLRPDRSDERDLHDYALSIRNHLPRLPPPPSFQIIISITDTRVSGDSNDI